MLASLVMDILSIQQVTTTVSKILEIVPLLAAMVTTRDISIHIFLTISDTDALSLMSHINKIKHFLGSNDGSR